MIEAPLLSKLDGISHGFFTRVGGASEGIYASMNCGLGSDDNPVIVTENRLKVAKTLGTAPKHLITPRQIHSPKAISTEIPWPYEKAPAADAIVTATPGLAVGVLTADCAPVLFAAPETGVIAAVHSGWRGAFEGILENTLIEMERLGASRANIIAAIGPTISQAAYEVGPEFRKKFMDEGPENARFFIKGRGDRYQFNLPSYIVDRLRSAGLDKMVDLELCTYGDESLFYSYRRSVHRNEVDYGRQISAIMLK